MATGGDLFASVALACVALVGAGLVWLPLDFMLPTAVPGLKLLGAVAGAAAAIHVCVVAVGRHKKKAM